MADPSSLIGSLPRAELAKLFTQPRVRAAFEQLFDTVQTTTPDSIAALAESVSQVEGLELVSRAIASRALSIATEALQSTQEGPPRRVLVMQPEDAAPPSAILARLEHLERTVSQLFEGPTP